MLSQSIVLPEDMPWQMGNEATGHEFVFRTSIPAGNFRLINQGVPYGKSTTAKARVGMADLEDYSQVDRLLAEQSGDVQLFRMYEDVAFLEGMGQTIEATFFYGNSVTSPAQFDGLSTFYSTIANAQNGANILNGGGTQSSNTSIWLVCWGQRTIYGAFPRGTKAGLEMEDKGDTVPGFDSAGNRFEAYTSWFRQLATLVPEDWRYAARIANIDTTSSGLAGTSPYDIFAGLANLMMLIPHLTKRASNIVTTDAKNDPAPGIRPVLYSNRTVRHWADVQAMRNRNVLQTINDYDGIAVTGFRDIPWKVSDQLLNTETTVT